MSEEHVGYSVTQETVEIPRGVLLLWLEVLRQGGDPHVPYSENWATMTKKALAISKDSCRSVLSLIEQYLAE